MRIGLGTAQFGMPYGISNTSGRPAIAAVAAVLARAADRGIRVVDTAAQYGESEKVLGEAFPGTHRFAIVTKTARFEAGSSGAAKADTVARGLMGSLERLGQPSVYGLLVHDGDELLGPHGNAIWGAMEKLRSDGFVQKIGMTTYTGEDIDTVLERFRPTLIQLPLNLLDQRLIESGHLAKLKRHGVEIHARSIFLQGLLLMRPDERHAYFRQFGEPLARYHAFLERHGLTPVRAAVAFLRSVNEVDVGLVGVTSVEQLEEILEAFEAPLPEVPFATLACSEPALLNPYLWQVH